jgi:hypothetical protein
MKMKSEQINELVKALCLAQSEFKPIKKDSLNPFYNKKYATLDAVIEATAEALRKHGLIVIQTMEGDSLITTLAHVSGQWISGSAFLHAIKQDPQGIGSAITYQRRYGYSAIVQCAPSDEDDDGNSHIQDNKSSNKDNAFKDLSTKIESSQKVLQLENVSNEITANKHLLKAGQLDALREDYKRRMGELKLQEVV